MTDKSSEPKKGTTLKLQFDKREFLRKPTDDVKITEEEIKTVVEEVTASISAGFLSFSASWKGIAAQFRNTCLKNTEMPTTTIEAVLTSLANQPNEGLSKLCKISYAAADGGGSTYGPGVRIFTVHKVVT